VAESLGRREALADHLHGFGIQPRPVEGWSAFLRGPDPIGLTVAPLEQGLWLADPDLALVTETQLYGERVRQERRRRARERDGEAIVRNLTELPWGPRWSTRSMGSVAIWGSRPWRWAAPPPSSWSWSMRRGTSSMSR
jgi:transcription-repair coupling factor (superfamily II helicase)